MDVTTKVLLDIARSDGSYETEYDGRMYTFCFYCGGEDGEHNHDCTIFQAQLALGDIWIQEVAKQVEVLRKKQEQEDKDKEYLRKLHTVVCCEYCGKKTREIAIERHQKESAKCKAKRASHDVQSICVIGGDV